METGDPLVQLLSRKLWDIRVVAAKPSGLYELLRPESLDAEGRADLGVPYTLRLVERASHQDGGVEDVEVELLGELPHMPTEHIPGQNQWELVGISYEDIREPGPFFKKVSYSGRVFLRKNGGWQLDLAMWKRRLSYRSAQLSPGRAHLSTTTLSTPTAFSLADVIKPLVDKISATVTFPKTTLDSS